MTINARASQLSSGSGVGPAARRPATAPSGAWESRPAFLFTGHGSQYKGMAEGLFEAHPVFREAIERCDGILGEELKPGLLDVLYGSPEARSLIHQSAYANPAFFALEYALARLWMSWGVTPACVVGHSVGEYAAACIAAVNAPGSVVVSGDRAAIGRLQSEFEREGVRAVRLNVSQAFHSPMMAPILDELREAAGSVRFNAPGIPYVSALTGSLAYNEVRQAGYWVEHFSEPVRFLDAMRSLFTLNPTDFIEIGPASELLRIGRQCASNGLGRASNGQRRDAKWIPSIGPDGGDCEIIAAGLAALSGRGVEADRPAFDPPRIQEARIDDLVRGHVARVTRIPNEDIHPHRPLREFGMDSLTSVELAGMIERETSVRLPFSMLSDRVTVSQIAAYVNDRLRSDRREKSFGPTTLTERPPDHAGSVPPDWRSPGEASREARVDENVLVRLREHGHKPPLYFVPAGDGDLLSFRHVVTLLDRDQPVFGLQPPRPRDVRGLRDMSIHWLVSKYVTELLQIQPAGPFRLAGYSAGGIFALEAARELKRRGHVVDLLVVLDPPSHISRWVGLAYGSLHRVCNLLGLTALARRSNSRWLLRRLHATMDEGLRTHVAIARDHEVVPYPGRITYFRSRTSWIRALNLTVSGRSWRDIAHALVGAVLMDLALADRIDTDLARLMVIDRTPTDNPMLDRVLRRIAEGEEPRDTRGVIETLASDEAAAIQDRALASLVERGIIERQEDKLSEAMVELLFLFRSPRYPKIDDEADREVKARIERVLFSDEIPYPRDIALICLADACGILEMVFDESELEKIASRMELLRKMDLIAREMGGMIAEVKRSPSTAWEMPVAPSSVSARALETSRQVACRASDSQKSLAKSSSGAPSLAGTRRIFVLCCAAGTPRMTPLSRIDSSRASHSFSAGYRAANSRKLSCANSSSTESRTATTDVDWASSEKTPNSPTVPPCEISSTIFASRPSSADNI